MPAAYAVTAGGTEQKMGKWIHCRQDYKAYGARPCAWQRRCKPDVQRGRTIRYDERRASVPAGQAGRRHSTLETSMHAVKRTGHALLALALMLQISVSLAAQPGAPVYQPEVGQDGKDVVWVPTAQSLVDRMMDLAKVTPADYVIDLGSGDGRTVITAAKRGARALGIEYNPEMVALSESNAAREGVSGKATFMKADLFETDLSKATVITMFLLPEINLKLRPKILDLKPGTRVVSNSFDMGAWEADKTVRAPGENCTSYCQAFLWIVPAKVAGTWRIGQDELTLTQEFQKLSGTLRTRNGAVAVSGKMNGAQIEFKAGDVQYAGRVDGDAMEGSSKSRSGSSPFRATRGASLR